jgi:opacity protein-like surface antigen
MKFRFLAGVVSLGVLISTAQAQESYRNDATVSALGSFQQSTNGNGINQTSTDSGGVLFTYRYFFTDHHGVELNYGYSRFSQQFSALNSSTPFQGTVGVPADTHEATASYVFRFGIGHRLTPFLSAGTGALVFSPNSFNLAGVNGSRFATPDFVYGAGADIALSKRISFRLGYRGHVFEAPDFGVPGLNTGSVTHMAEPFGGLSFHF